MYIHCIGKSRVSILMDDTDPSGANDLTLCFLD